MTDANLSTLRIGYPEIRRAIGVQAGMDQDPSNWSSDVVEVVDDMIRDGYLMALHPPVVGGAQIEWDFLRPSMRLQLGADQWRYRLPQDFGRIIGRISYDPTLNYSYPSIQETNVSRIHQLRNQQTTTGAPRWCAIEPEGSTGAQAQDRAVIFHPTPDSDYVLRLQYRVEPQMLTDDNPYPVGGPEFSRLVLTACLARAEEAMEETRGVRYQSFLDAAASLYAEQIRRAPAVLGYSGPRRKPLRSRSAARAAELLNYETVTYEGQEYSG